MDMSDTDKFGLEKRNDNPTNYHSPGSMSSDWLYDGVNVPNSSLGLVLSDRQMPVCGDRFGASSCKSASVVDSFGPAFWDHTTNSQTLGFCDVNIQNNASTSNTIGIGQGTAASLRSGIDRTLDLGRNPPSSMLKGSTFLHTVPGMLPQSLSQLPADSAFIMRAARSSYFSDGNFSDIVNPFVIPEPVGLYLRGGGMVHGPGEVFPGGGLKLVSGGQAQKNSMNVGEAFKDASLSAECAATEGSPLKNERKSENLPRSLDGAKQGVGGSRNEPDVAEFSGGGQDEPSILEGNGGESSARNLNSKKRKRSGQDTELDQAKGSQQLGEAAKDNPEMQQRGEQKPSPSANKTAGKHSKQGSQDSDPPKEEYIHIRARRGQATNSHSLAERVRREKISERMKFLQDLVPGCSKVTGKAVMLDEIINYVQSLQRQVEFLSMKLATVNLRLGFNMEGLLAKDILQSQPVPSSALPFSSEMAMAYPPLHPSQPGLIQPAFPGMESHSDVLRRTINSQLTSMPGGFKEPTQQLPNMWDDGLHNVVQMSYATTTPQDSQDVNGSQPPGHLKVEL